MGLRAGSLDMDEEIIRYVHSDVIRNILNRDISLRTKSHPSSGLFPHCPEAWLASQGQTQKQHRHSRPGGTHCVGEGVGREQARFYPAGTQYSLSQSQG